MHLRNSISVLSGLLLLQYAVATPMPPRRRNISTEPQPRPQMQPSIRQSAARHPVVGDSVVRAPSWASQSQPATLSAANRQVHGQPAAGGQSSRTESTSGDPSLYQRSTVSSQRRQQQQQQQQQQPRGIGSQEPNRSGRAPLTRASVSAASTSSGSGSSGSAGPIRARRGGSLQEPGVVSPQKDLTPAEARQKEIDDKQKSQQRTREKQQQAAPGIQPPSPLVGLRTKGTERSGTASAPNSIVSAETAQGLGDRSGRSSDLRTSNSGVVRTPGPRKIETQQSGSSTSTRLLEHSSSPIRPAWKGFSRPAGQSGSAASSSQAYTLSRSESIQYLARQQRESIARGSAGLAPTRTPTSASGKQVVSSGGAVPAASSLGTDLVNSASFHSARSSNYSPVASPAGPDTSKAFKIPAIDTNHVYRPPPAPLPTLLQSPGSAHSSQFEKVSGAGSPGSLMSHNSGLLGGSPQGSEGSSDFSRVSGPASVHSSGFGGSQQASPAVSRHSTESGYQLA